MRRRILRDYGGLSYAAAGIVAQRIRAKPSAVFMLPTGSTPLGMYRRLIEMHAEESLSFARATFFNLDEYLGLPRNHQASYRFYMEENFYCCVDVDLGRVQVPDGNAPDPQAECERYEAAIRKAGGVDLCVLGIGRNGHIGFKEPDSPFDSRTRVVQLSESTRRVNAEDFEGTRAPEKAITGLAPKLQATTRRGGLFTIELPPLVSDPDFWCKAAITVGMGTIFESKEILLLASGESKARAVAEAVEGLVRDDVPASILQRHPNATFLLDRDAASALTRQVS